jgi:hypothetical protein
MQRLTDVARRKDNVGSQNWSLLLPRERLIGELCAIKARDRVHFTVGPDHYHSLADPFSSSVTISAHI